LAESTSLFEHGNLVRGVCVLGMLSQTFACALRQHANSAYLQNAQLSATTARAMGLVHTVSAGVNTTKIHAHKVSSLTMYCTSLVGAAHRRRTAIDTAQLAREAVSHVECQLSGGGFAKSPMVSHATPLEDTVHLKPIETVDSAHHLVSHHHGKVRLTRGSLAPLPLHLNGSGHGFQQRTELHFINAEVTLQALHADVAAAVDQHVTVYCGEVHGCGLLSTSGASTVLAHDRASFSALCIHNRNAAGLVRVTTVGRLPLGVSERAMPPDAPLGAAEARCLGLADVVGSATELSVESRRLKQQLGHVHSLVSRANQAEPHSGELSKGSTCRMPSVQFDTASGVASVQVGASLNAAAVHRAVYALIPLENTVSCGPSLFTLRLWQAVR